MPKKRAKEFALPLHGALGVHSRGSESRTGKRVKKDEDCPGTREDVLDEDEDNLDDEINDSANDNDQPEMETEDRGDQPKTHKTAEPPIKNEGKESAGPSGLGIESFFNLIFDTSLIKHLTDYINWRETLIPEHVKNAYSRKWRETTEADVKGFVGVVYLMGMLPKVSWKAYWRKEEGEEAPELTLLHKFLSRERYEQIISCFEEGSKPDLEPEDTPCEFALDPLVTLFCDLILQNSREQWKDSKVLVFDSSTTIIKPLSKDPVRSSRMKAYLVMDAKTGYILNCELGEEVEDALMIVDTACKLLSPFKDKSYEVFIGGDYTSNRLFSRLLEMNIKACGKISYQDIEAPKALKFELNALPAMVSRQYVFDRQTLGLWKDEKEIICLLSTIHYPKPSDSQKSKSPWTVSEENLTLNEMVSGYGLHMGNGNLFDKKMLEFSNSYILGSQKPNLIALYFMLEVAMVNSYIMYTQSLPEEVALSQREYRFKVIEKLHEDQKKPLEFAKKTMEDFARLEKIQNLSRLGRCSIVASGKCVICRICSIPKIKRVRTKYKCQTCQIPICIVGCYDYHRLMSEAHRFPVVKR